VEAWGEVHGYSVLLRQGELTWSAEEKTDFLVSTIYYALRSAECHRWTHRGVSSAGTTHDQAAALDPELYRGPRSVSLVGDGDVEETWLERADMLPPCRYCYIASWSSFQQCYTLPRAL